MTKLKHAKSYYGKLQTDMIPPNRQSEWAEVKEIITRGYLAKPTRQGRAFAFMNTLEWEGFVKGVSKIQLIELKSILASYRQKLKGEVEGLSCDIVAPSGKPPFREDYIKKSDVIKLLGGL